MQNAPESDSPEVRVLVQCARRNLEPSNVDSLRTFLRGQLSWDLLLQQADDHGLIPLLNEHLLEIGTESAPGDSILRLQTISRECALRSLFLSTELIRILGGLREAGIPAIPHKGPVLAARAYGNLSLRQYGDLDIVTPQQFIPAVSEEMLRLGYQPKSPHLKHSGRDTSRVPGEYVFVDGANRVMVEIHTECTLRYFPRVPNLQAMIQRATTVRMNDHEVSAFSLEDELLMLAVHGAKDLWARLIWIADIAEMVKTSPSLQWKELFARASDMRIGRMLKLALLLAHEILELPLPPEAEAQARGDRMAARLASDVQVRLFAGAEAPNGVLQRSLFRVRMVEGFLGGMRYWIRLSTAPADEDWQMVDVPKPLARSYFLLRPFRLWKKYSARSPHSS